MSINNLLFTLNFGHSIIICLTVISTLQVLHSAHADPKKWCFTENKQVSSLILHKTTSSLLLFLDEHTHLPKIGFKSCRSTLTSSHSLCHLFIQSLLTFVFLSTSDSLIFVMWFKAVPDFANISTRSFCLIPECLGHQKKQEVIVYNVWNFIENFSN